MKVAFVYDRVNKFGGAERILLALHEIWPRAPLYTAVYDEQKAPWAKVFPKIIPSFLQSFPLARNNHELYPLLMPLAFESFNFDQFDFVISVTSESAKGIITKPHTHHICYCLTPTRYLWSGYFDYQQSISLGLITPFVKLSYPFLARKLRRWDYIASQKPDLYLSISQNVSERISKYYRRSSDVIYPPVDTEYFTVNSNNKKNGFLMVSRLVPYKRVDIAIEAFNQLGWPLTVVGTGRDASRLKSLAHTNIQFIEKNLTEEELLSYYQTCQCLIFTSDEDLGLVPIEANACGTPVIAYRKGGAIETIQEGETGEFYDEQTKQSLILTLLQFAKKDYNSKACRLNTMPFSKKHFILKFEESIKKLL